MYFFFGERALFNGALCTRRLPFRSHPRPLCSPLRLPPVSSSPGGAPGRRPGSARGAGVRFPCPPPCREAARCEALGLRPVPAAREAPEARSPPEAPPPFPQRSTRALPPPRAPGREPAATPVPFTRMPAPVPSRCGLPGPFSPCRWPPPSSSSHGSRASHRLRAGRPRWRLLRGCGSGGGSDGSGCAGLCRRGA